MTQTRLDLRIDIFEKPAQRALVLPEVTPLQLVDAILKEFHDLEYLGDTPTNYRLARVGHEEPLDEATPLSHQLADGNHFTLLEQEVGLPEQTQPMTQPIYLREQRTGKTYRLPWQPAIIGRVSDNQPLNRQVAVDLTNFPTAVRVSRRHARVGEENGTFYIEVLADNPVSILRNQLPVIDGAMEGRFPLQPGDIIRLDRSDLLLKFIVRPTAPIPSEASPELIATETPDGS